MKRIIVTLLAVCALVSCSSDDETEKNISITPGGLFVSANETQMIGVWIYSGQCTGMVAYRKDGEMYRIDGFMTDGEWPKYTYSNGTFQMSVTFDGYDATSFVADYSGELTGYTLGYYPETITTNVNGKGQKFTITNEPIDANGDGIPDIMQDL